MVSANNKSGNEGKEDKKNRGSGHANSISNGHVSSTTSAMSASSIMDMFDLPPKDGNYLYTLI